MHLIPYLLNILILAPVVSGLLRHPAGEPVMAFSGASDSPVLRVMIASLWAGVMLISILALFDPQRFWPLLVFQVLYKAIFVVLWCLPIWLGLRAGVVPTGPVAVFVVIILVWPFFIVMALRDVQM